MMYELKKKYIKNNMYRFNKSFENVRNLTCIILSLLIKNMTKKKIVLFSTFFFIGKHNAHVCIIIPTACSESDIYI